MTLAAVRALLAARFVLRPLTVARVLAAAGTAAHTASSLAFQPERMLAATPIARLVLDLLAIASLGRRRFRFAAASWFVLVPLLRLADRSGGPFEEEVGIAGLALGLGAAAALHWPRRRARAVTDPLPALPHTWVALATAIVVVADVFLSAAFPGSGDVGRTAMATVVLFAALALGQASRSGLLIAALGGVLADHIALGGSLGTPGGALRITATLAFVLAFPWLRQAPDSLARVVRGTAFVFVVSLVPPLLVVPHQVLVEKALLAAIGRALAFGLALGLAPRVAGAARRPRRVTYFALPRAPEVWLLGVFSILVLAAVAGVVRGLALGLVLVSTALMLRLRAVRTMLVMALVVMLAVAGSPFARHAEPLSLATALACWLVAFLASSPAAAAHFVRIPWPAFAPRPRLDATLAGAGVAAMVVVVLALARDPAALPTVVDGLVGPSSLVRVAVFTPPPLLDATDQTSPSGATVAEDPLGRGTWVVDEERDEVALVGVDGSVFPIAVGRWPEEIVVDARGTAFVSCRGEGSVAVVAPDLSIRRVAVGAEPRALALDQERNRLYVGLVTALSVVAIDTRSLAVVARRGVGVEPRAMAVVPEGLAVLPGRGGSVHYLARDLTWSRSVPLYAHGRSAWHGQALVAAGRDLVVVHAAIDTGLSRPVASGGYGGGVREPIETLVAVLRGGRAVLYPERVEARRRIRTGLVSGAVVTGGRLVVASRGTGELLTCSLAGRVECVPLAKGSGLTGVSVARDGGVVTLAAFDRQLLRTAPGGPTRAIALGAGRLEPELQLGRKLFHASDDRRIAAAGIGCATCHPDGRDDGLVWRLQGERRQTPMLAGRLADTAPFNWEGSSPTLAANVQQTVSRLGGTGLGQGEVAALARYLGEGLRVPVLPAPTDPALVAAGERLFHDDRVGCHFCHKSDERFAGGGLQDVRSLSPVERGEMRAVGRPNPGGAFDTPSLRFVGLSAPYFHDGSAESLEVLLGHNRDRMGRTDWLEPGQRRALIAYLRTL